MTWQEVRIEYVWPTFASAFLRYCYKQRMTLKETARELGRHHNSERNT